MITKVQFENWKSYDNADLYIDSLSVLIGTNASGKSNALDALVFLNRVASGSALTSALQGDGVQSPLRGGLEWAARKPGNTFALAVTCRSDEQTDYEYRIECSVTDKRCDVYSEQLVRSKYRLDGQKRRKSALPNPIKLFRTDHCDDNSPTIVARLYNEKGGSPRQLGRSQSVLSQLLGQKLRQEIADGLTEVITVLRELFILDPIPSHMRGYSPLAERLESDARNLAGVIAVLTASRPEAESVLTNYVSRLPERDITRVYAETVGKFNADAMLYCEEHWTESGQAPIVDARGMSDGTLRFLAILTALLTRPKGSLLVIEEVDNGLHPSRAGLLLNMLKEIGTQQSVDVLVTTHNPALLDAMGTAMIPYITVAHRNSETGCSSLVLLEDISNLPKLLSQGTVGRLSSRGIIGESLSSVVASEELALA
jgi:predicted ATPase